MKQTPKFLIDGICEIELTSPREVIKDYDQGYTHADYVYNEKLPRKMRRKLEKRLYKDQVDGIRIVHKMQRKAQEALFGFLFWAVILTGVVFLIVNMTSGSADSNLMNLPLIIIS